MLRVETHSNSNLALMSRLSNLNKAKFLHLISCLRLMNSVLVLNGPNLNLLGTREPQFYGLTSLAELDDQLLTQAKVAGLLLSCIQSNSESEIINHIHQAKDNQVNYIILNPAAFTHTSIAIRDALLAVNLPFIEVHLSNIHSRESFRRRSYFSDIAQGVISGLGTLGYSLALQAIIDKLNQ